MKRNPLLALLLFRINHNKWSKIMKISLFLLFVCTFQLMSINSNAQNVTIKIASGNITVGQFLKAIEEQTEYLVVYSNREIETERVANIKAGTNKVTELLSNVFKNTDVKYEFENNYIILSKQSKGTQPSILQQSQKKITGTVSDPNGDPIIGANVVEKGTTNGTITDLDGKFSLSLPANATLLISYIGYTSQEVPIGNQTSVSIQLQESMGKLDEVIVVGYGTQRKSSMTAAVTNVNTKELQNIPRPSIYSALQGRVAGLTINESSGEPDKAASLLIRGLGTIDGGTEPLILIDGSPSGTLSHLSTFDIESISVLKDAAASAIYGARAANGVILVTTKQGRIDDDKPMIQFDSYVGLQTLAQFPKTLSAYEYATLVNEVHRNDGKSNVYSDTDLEMFKNGQTDDFHGNTNWKDRTLLKVAPIFTNHLSVSGNGKLGRYYVSGEYVDQKGMVRKIDNYDRMNLRANITSDITKKIQFQFMSNYIRTHKDNGGLSGTFSNVLAASSTAQEKYSDGNWGSMIFADGHYLWDTGNPVKSINEYGPVETYWNTLNTMASLQYQPISGLTLKAMGSYRYSWSDSQSYSRSWTSWDPLKQEIAQSGPASLQENWDKEMKYDLQLTATYEKTIHDHFFKILGGYSQENLRSDFIKGYRKNFINDSLWELNAGDASTQTNEGGADQWSFVSFFGRANYTFMNKYLFEANLRYDGSSRFAPGKQWGLFPSFSLGWNISKESFLSKYDFIDNLKVRLSWGQLGNAEKVGLYLWFPGVESGAYYNFDDKLVFGTRPAKFANKDLTWETTTSYNLGLDGSFLNGKYTFEIDLWKKNTDDVLLTVPISTTIGAPDANLTVNAGKIGSHGFDLSVGTNGNFTKDLTYSARFSLTGWNSWVIDLKDRATAFSTEYRPGEELGNYYGYECLGIINDEKTLDEYKKLENVAPQIALGDLMYKDQNGDGRLDYLDNVKLGNWNTKNSFGLNLGLGYKGFDLQVFFQGAFNVDKQISGNTRTSFHNFWSPDANQLDRWTEENRNADALYPRLRKEYSHNTDPMSSFWVKSASYIKLKNLQIGYNFPQSFTSKIRVKTLRLYVSGTNLFTIAPDFLDGYDPEGDMKPDIYPTLRVYSIGLNVNF